MRRSVKLPFWYELMQKLCLCTCNEIMAQGSKPKVKVKNINLKSERENAEEEEEGGVKGKAFPSVMTSVQYPLATWFKDSRGKEAPKGRAGFQYPRGQQASSRLALVTSLTQ